MSEIIQLYRSGREQPSNRSILNDVIPLSSPYQLVIDSTNACNFKCEFCPTGDPELIKKSGRPFGNMSYELFCKIIDDCKKFPTKLKRIDFGKDGEPLLNKKFPDMVRYAKNANVTDFVATATNAALLSKDKIDQLIDAGIDMIKISVEAVSDEGYKKITKVNFDYNDLIDRVTYLYKNKKGCKVYSKIIDFGLTKEEKEKFFKDFDPISDYITIDQPSGWSITEAKDFTLGFKPEGYLDLPIFNKKEVCPLPFFTLSLNFNGEVSICCVDWAHATVVGDLTKESLYDVWNGERLFEFRKMHLTGNRKDNKACADCFAINGSIDNLDSQAKDILEKITAERALR